MTSTKTRTALINKPCKGCGHQPDEHRLHLLKKGAGCKACACPDYEHPKPLPVWLEVIRWSALWTAFGMVLGDGLRAVIY